MECNYFQKFVYIKSRYYNTLDIYWRFGYDTENYEDLSQKIKAVYQKKQGDHKK